MEVTLPLEVFLSVLIADKDYVITSSTVAEAVKKADPDATKAYVEYVKEGVARVWYKRHWLRSVERQQKLREASERRNKRIAAHEEALGTAINYLVGTCGIDKITATDFIRRAPTHLLASMLADCGSPVNLEALTDHGCYRASLDET